MSTVKINSTIPGPRSQELWRRRQTVVARGVPCAAPVFAASASGAALTDVDGNVFLDFFGGIGVLNVGHTAPQVVAAIKEQAEQLIHSCFIATPYEGYIAVLEELARLTPGTFSKKGLLVNSGAEAVENAVKIARHATGRQSIVVFTNAFHGRTLLTLSMTGKQATYKKGFGPFAPEVHRLLFPYPYRGVSSQAALVEFRRALHEEIGPEQVAAVVMELVQGEGGFLPAPVDFVQGVVETCRNNGILFVADEIQTGFCRTGRMFASEHYGIEPDLLCFAKSVAAGLPLAGVIGRAEVMDSPQIGGLGSTFGGNPVACAAALATLRVMRDEGLAERATALGYKVLERFHRWSEEFELIGDTRGLGAMAALEFVRDRNSKEPAAEETDVICRESYQHGLLVIKAGIYNNVIRFLAPLVIRDDQLEEGLAILGDAIARASELSSGSGSGIDDAHS